MMTARLQELLTIMERLRAPDGCPWDREQTFASIAPYTIEEAYEVADAVASGDMTHLKDELGDLLFQVVFHAQMAREAGQFDFDAVAAAVCEKLVRRHPHLFAAAAPRLGQGHGQRQGQGSGSGPEREPGSESGAGPVSMSGSGPGQRQEAGAAAAQQRVWEDVKARERAAIASGASGALDGVPAALPALMRACKLSKRAARVGFDFPHAAETADKVAEELAEVREAAGARVGADVSPEIFEEIGDLLFAAANLARKLDVDAEAALRAANGKFERRFRGMERLAAQRGLNFERLDLAAQEALWQEVKRAE